MNTRRITEQPNCGRPGWLDSPDAISKAWAAFKPGAALIAALIAFLYFAQHAEAAEPTPVSTFVLLPGEVDLTVFGEVGRTTTADGCVIAIFSNGYGPVRIALVRQGSASHCLRTYYAIVGDRWVAK